MVTKLSPFSTQRFLTPVVAWGGAILKPRKLTRNQQFRQAVKETIDFLFSLLSRWQIRPANPKWKLAGKLTKAWDHEEINAALFGHFTLTPYRLPSSPTKHCGVLGLRTCQFLHKATVVANRWWPAFHSCGRIRLNVQPGVPVLVMGTWGGQEGHSGPKRWKKL